MGSESSAGTPNAAFDLTVEQQSPSRWERIRSDARDEPMARSAVSAVSATNPYCLESYRRILVTCGVRRQLFETSI
jgi:hypothetical protein